MSCFASSCYRRPPPRFASGSYDVTVTLFKFAFSGVLHASEPQSQMSVCYRYESRSALPGPLLSMRSMMCGNRNPPPAHKQASPVGNGHHRAKEQGFRAHPGQPQPRQHQHSPAGKGEWGLYRGSYTNNRCADEASGGNGPGMQDHVRPHAHAATGVTNLRRCIHTKANAEFLGTHYMPLQSTGAQSES